MEMYIVHRDRTGRRFVDLLAAKARAGVTVRVAYDWFGCGSAPLFGIFRPLVAAGGEVRVFNRPTARAALGWVRRNHRKLITVDGRVAFVSGLCIGQMWEGIPAKKREPWRDTGVEIAGPAVALAEQAFADSWTLAGGVIDRATLPDPDRVAPAGDVTLRLIPTEPFAANLLRMDLLVSSLARHTLWITDAYFIGTGAYIEALRRAALDGVDVRLLLPSSSDVGWVLPASRALYRPLLEAGVRVFEWNGTMVHSKTAVADSRWSRIGSTNLNINSWIGNWELDVAIEDAGIARTMEAHYLEDLSRCTEIVLERPRAVPAERFGRPLGRPGQARRMVRAVTGVGRSLGAAVTGNRSLETFERRPLVFAFILLIVIALLAFFAPRLVAWPIAAMALWGGATFLFEALFLTRRNKHQS
jgi:phosphatidylserine/phosphatidylglycerophosphate/cardiolipin synthase-like enzyme